MWQSFFSTNWIFPCVGEQGHRPLWIYILPTLRPNRQERDSPPPWWIKSWGELCLAWFGSEGWVYQPSQEYLLSPVDRESVTDGPWDTVHGKIKYASLYIQPLCCFTPLIVNCFFVYLSLNCKLPGQGPWLLYLCIPVPLAWCLVKGRTSISGGCWTEMGWFLHVSWIRGYEILQLMPKESHGLQS